MATVRKPWTAFIFSLVLLCAVPTLAARSQVVISQVYGGGGNSGSPLRNDFIELFNQGPVAVSVEGWSIQYASSSGSSWQSTVLSGWILPHQWFLIEEAGGTSGGAPLPTADDTGSFGMSASGGKIALLDSSVQLSGTCPTSPHLVDFLGWGNTTCFKGSGPAPATSNTTAAMRKDSGMAASGNNASDFAARAPSPRNSRDIPLSVQVAVMKAVPIPGNGVRITWSTFTELENFGFYVERKSKSDTTFVLIEGSFQEGCGTSGERHDYAYVDSLGANSCLYRLRQLDLSGQVHFSDTIHVESSTASSTLKASVSLVLRNQPNPFNPTTIITFAVPQTEQGRIPIRLRVFDILGRLVADLVNGSYIPGVYSIRFDGSRSPSGVYICRVEATIQGTAYRLTRSMVLLK